MRKIILTVLLSLLACVTLKPEDNAHLSLERSHAASPLVPTRGDPGQLASSGSRLAPAFLPGSFSVTGTHIHFAQTQTSAAFSPAAPPTALSL